jgi:hypothetical protein
MFDVRGLISDVMNEESRKTGMRFESGNHESKKS